MRRHCKHWYRLLNYQEKPREVRYVDKNEQPKHNMEIWELTAGMWGKRGGGTAKESNGGKY